jgi:hypothetical protein
MELGEDNVFRSDVIDMTDCMTLEHTFFVDYTKF